MRSNINKKFFSAIIAISILTFLSFYIFQINALAKETYLIQGYEKELNRISGTNEALEVNFSKANSLKNIENYIQAKNFKKVTQVKYIHILEGSVAARQ